MVMRPAVIAKDVECQLFSLKLDVEVLFVRFGFVNALLDAGHTIIKLAMARVIRR